MQATCVSTFLADDAVFQLAQVVMTDAARGLMSGRKDDPQPKPGGETL